MTKEFIQFLDTHLVDKKFKNTKTSLEYYFYPAPDFLTGTTVVVADTNPNPDDGKIYGTGIIPIHLTYKNGVTTIKLEGETPYIVKYIQLPLSSEGVTVLTLINSQGEEFHLRELN